MLCILLCQELVNLYTSCRTFDTVIYDVYQNRSNNLNERNFLTPLVIFFSIDGIPEKTFYSFPSEAYTLSS